MPSCVIERLDLFNYMTLLAVGLLIAWFASEFSDKRWLRMVVGCSVAITTCSLIYGFYQRKPRWPPGPNIVISDRIVLVHPDINLEDAPHGIFPFKYTEGTNFVWPDINVAREIDGKLSAYLEDISDKPPAPNLPGWRSGISTVRERVNSDMYFGTFLQSATEPDRVCVNYTFKWTQYRLDYVRFYNPTGTHPNGENFWFYYKPAEQEFEQFGIGGSQAGPFGLNEDSELRTSTTRPSFR